MVTPRDMWERYFTHSKKSPGPASSIFAGLKSRILLQVHDELLFEVAEGERDALETLVREQMGSAYPLDVPLEVSVGYGPSWDAAAH